MASLPYMPQLPQHFSWSPPVTPASPTPVEPPQQYTPPIPYSISVITGAQHGGTWVGRTPPSNPATGWLWLNTANNALYTYTAQGAWQQVGTNW